MGGRKHTAVITPAIRAQLQTAQLPTPSPTGNQVLVRNLWTASTPLDLHQTDGGLLVTHPQVLGDGVAGRVVTVGSDVRHLKANDLVFGFTWRSEMEKAHQEYVCAEENVLGKVPAGWEQRLHEVVTLPNNFVTAWHTLIQDLNISLPWPKPNNFTLPTQSRILIWGGSSSVGQYVLQILRYYGYENVVATASPRNFDIVKDSGANHVVDYKLPAQELKNQVENTSGGRVEKILDCIGSLEGSVTPISRVAEGNATVAVLLPVIIRDATEDVEPHYAMDPEKVVEWTPGVEVKGVRTHFYLQDHFMAKHLQPDIMPTLLAEGVVKPNRQKIVEGNTLLERAQKALDMLRRKEVSGERLVWRIAEDVSI